MKSQEIAKRYQQAYDQAMNEGQFHGDGTAAKDNDKQQIQVGSSLHPLSCPSPLTRALSSADANAGEQHPEAGHQPVECRQHGAHAQGVGRRGGPPARRGECRGRNSKAKPFCAR